MKLLLNRAKCKNCRDVITSYHLHDFVVCKCFVNDSYNQGISLDGGTQYQKIGGNLDNFIDKSKWSSNERN